MNNPRSLGRVDEAINAAESAAFHAANVCQAHLGSDADRNRLLAELCEAANALRKITQSSQIAVVGENFDYGPPILSAGGRALRRLRMKRSA